MATNDIQDKSAKLCSEQSVTLTKATYSLEIINSSETVLLRSTAGLDTYSSIKSAEEYKGRRGYKGLKVSIYFCVSKKQK